jgi:hypothetical protein
MEGGIYIKDYLILAAFALGFLGIGVGIGITIYQACLPWFLAHIPVTQLRETIERASPIYQARWRREVARKKRWNFHATGRHLVGVPSRRSAVEEVKKEFATYSPPLESRRL